MYSNMHIQMGRHPWVFLVYDPNTEHFHLINIFKATLPLAGKQFCSWNQAFLCIYYSFTIRTRALDLTLLDAAFCIEEGR